MLGVIANAVAVILGAIFGLVFKKGISQRVSDELMVPVALVCVYIGISGILKCNNTLIIVLSMVIGTAIGSTIDIDKHFNDFVNRIEAKFKKENSSTSIAQGFIAGSLLFCVGAMTIVGSLEAGLTGNNETLYSKSILDFISSIVLTTANGIGVMFSSLFVFVFQGSIVMLSKLISPFLSDPVVCDMTTCGSLIIIALSFNLLKITKIKLMNLMPSVFLPILFYLFVK